MSEVFRQEYKKLVGHPDFGPVIAEDTLRATVSSLSGVAGHTALATFTAPRSMLIRGAVAHVDSALSAGSIEYAVHQAGSVVVSGVVPNGQQSDAVFKSRKRAEATVVASGTSVALFYAVSSDLGAAKELTVSVPVAYVAKV